MGAVPNRQELHRDAADRLALTEVESARLRTLFPVRWRTLVIVWLAQAVLAPVAFVVLMDPKALVLLSQGRALSAQAALGGQLLDLVSDWSVTVGFGVSLVLTVCAQVAFLAPASSASAGPARRTLQARARLLLQQLFASLGLCWCVGMLVYVVAECLKVRTDFFAFDDFETWLACLALGGVVSVVVGMIRRGALLSARWSLFIAASYAVCLVLGALGILWGVLHMALPDLSDEGGSGLLLMSVAACVLLWWPVMSMLFFRYFCGPDPTSDLSRVAEWLFKGTIVEVVLAIPVDVMIRRRTDCYCGEGTFFTFVFAWAVGFFALGPIVALLPFSRARRRVLRQRCPSCNYPRAGIPVDKPCPECALPALIDPAAPALVSNPPAPQAGAGAPSTPILPPSPLSAPPSRSQNP